MATRSVRSVAGPRRGILVALALVAVAGTSAPRIASALHTDEQLGFSMQTPSGWKQIPIASEEKFIVAKYLCDREYADKKEGRTHTPDLKVLVFPKGAKKTAQVEKDGDTSLIHIENPYKDYPDYVKSDNTGGGHFISKEDKVVVNGIDATWYEVKYEKLTVARRAIAFAYHADDCDYVAQYEVLESYWDKLSPNLITSLKSFKIFPRKGSIKREVTGDGSGVSVTKGEGKLTDEERAKKRQEKFEQRVRVAQERLPEGWKMKRSKNFVAFTHVDARYTDYVLDQAEALRTWLDANFGWIGTGYVSGDVIRICADSAEESAFRDTSARSGWVTEITMSRTGGFYEFRSLNDRVRERYFRERNQEFGFAMPPWLSRGLDQMISSSYMKGGKLEFRADGQEILAVRLAAKAGKLAKPKDIVLATYKPFDQSSFSSDPMRMKPSEDPLDQAPGFVRWLVLGPGAKNPRTKELLRTYVEALLGVERTVIFDSSKVAEEPKTEEEEEERFKNRQSAWRDNEKERLQQVFDKVFGQWTEADWAAVEKSYTAYVS